MTTKKTKFITKKYLLLIFLFALLLFLNFARPSQASLQNLYKSLSERGTSSENSAGTVVSAIDSNGVLNTRANSDGTTSLLSITGNVLANVKLDTNGKIASATDANGNTIKTETDKNGNTILKGSDGNDITIQTASAQGASGSDFSDVSYGKGYYTPMEAIPGLGKPETFYDYVRALYRFGVGAIGICAMLMIIIGGYMYVASAGNNASMEKAKGIITDAILGLILALASYLILYVINPDLVKIKKLGTATSTTGGSTTGGTETGGESTLAQGCNNYTEAFNSAAGGDKSLKCLLIGIANQESSCNPSAVSSHNACGIMQMLPSTAGVSCEELKNDPSKSISLAKNLIVSSKSNLNNYSQFSIGSNYSQSGTTVTYGSYTYDTGNDDLIASYNAGSGKLSSDSSKKGPFEISSDCPSPKTPAWQCNINPGGFSETQNYVVKVQAYQKKCLEE